MYSAFCADVEMRLTVPSVLRVVISVSPALFILILTVIISLMTEHPQGLLLTRSIRGILVRDLFWSHLYS